MVLHNFCLNGNALFELNMFGLLPHYFTLQNISICPVNGMGTYHVIGQDRTVDYQILTYGVYELLIILPH